LADIKVNDFSLVKKHNIDISKTRANSKKRMSFSYSEAQTYSKTILLKYLSHSKIIFLLARKGWTKGYVQKNNLLMWGTKYSCLAWKAVRITSRSI